VSLYTRRKYGLRMLFWAALAVTMATYDQFHGPAWALSVCLFFCGANFAAADFEQIHAPLFERLKRLVGKAGRP